VSAQSDTPVLPVAVVGAFMSLYFDKSLDGSLRMAVELEALWCRKVPPSPIGMPVFLSDPLSGLVGMPTIGPGAQLQVGVVAQFRKRRAGCHGSVVVGPAANDRIEVLSERGLRSSHMAMNAAGKRPLVPLDCALAGRDECLER
jgi:hypothetical protein